MDDQIKRQTPTPGGHSLLQLIVLLPAAAASTSASTSTSKTSTSTTTTTTVTATATATTTTATTTTTTTRYDDDYCHYYRHLLRLLLLVADGISHFTTILGTTGCNKYLSCFFHAQQSRK